MAMAKESELQRVENCAKHFATTTLMNVPPTLTPRRFAELVTDRYKAVCEEQIKELERRAAAHKA